MKNAHLSSNSSNFLNATKYFNEICRISFYADTVNLAKKIYNNSRDIEFSLGDYFFGAPYILHGDGSSSGYMNERTIVTTVDELMT